ncbi:MAG TPA: hypothetical protein VNJ52_08240 [Patescibacteria group bacterium]|nr:hypothetical protein [Patescibacteria group bacterium]
MKVCRVGLAAGAILCGATAGFAQANPPTPVLLTHPPPAAVSQSSPETIELVVPKGTPLRVSLIKKVRIRKVGDPVTARVLEPVYAFDRVAVAAGSEVTGKVVQIIPASKLVRTEAILNGDFTPLKTAKVEFDTLILKNGTHMALDTRALPGTQDVIRLVTRQNDKKPSLVDQAKQAIDQRWRNAIDQVKAPGKLHRLEQMGLNELPYHRQYLHAGTVYDAELIKPLDFGKATIAPQETAGLGQVPPQNSVVEARLLTALSSATAVKGTPVKALVTKPLFSSKKKKRLLLPEGTELEGDVVQARSARHLHRNGQLRFVIRKMELPSGPWERVDASIEGLEVGRNANLALDSEGGASVKQSKKRYLTTALAIAIAATTVAGDSDHHMGSMKQAVGGDAGTNGLAGGSGFRLVGLVMGAGLRSRALGSVLGFYGAARSVYFHFLARGHDVVLAKDTPMEIAFGPRLGPPAK